MTLSNDRILTWVTRPEAQRAPNWYTNNLGDMVTGRSFQQFSSDQARYLRTSLVEEEEKTLTRCSLASVPLSKLSNLKCGR